MRLLTIVLASLAIAAVVAGCGGSGSDPPTTDAKEATQLKAAIEKLVTEGPGAGTGTSSGLGAGGRVLTPQEAKQVFREMRQNKGSGEGKVLRPVEELAQKLREEAH